MAGWLAVGWFSIARFEGDPYPYLVRWLWPIVVLEPAAAAGGPTSGRWAGGSLPADRRRRVRPPTRPRSRSSGPAGARRGRGRPRRGRRDVGHGLGQPGRPPERGLQLGGPPARPTRSPMRFVRAGTVLLEHRTPPGARRRRGWWPSSGARGPAVRDRRARARLRRLPDDREPAGRRRARGGDRRRAGRRAVPVTSRRQRARGLLRPARSPTSASTPMRSPAAPRRVRRASLTGTSVTDP